MQTQTTPSPRVKTINDVLMARSRSPEGLFLPPLVALSASSPCAVCCPPVPPRATSPWDLRCAPVLCEYIGITKYCRFFILACACKSVLSHSRTLSHAHTKNPYVGVCRPVSCVVHQCRYAPQVHYCCFPHRLLLCSNLNTPFSFLPQGTLVFVTFLN
jgi:hypothetical protein